MQISIIIVNYNVTYFLQQCLQSVYAALHNLQGEIIVVDNASADGSCEMVKEKFPDVKLIANTTNVGFSKANNLGVSQAKGKYILILNPDTVLAEDTLQKLFLFSENNPETGAVGVPLYDGIGKFLPESKRNIPTTWVSLKKMLGFSNTYYANQLDERNSGRVPVLVGAFMWMEKSKYEEVKGFDEDYFMYGEDIDLSYKLLKKGYFNYYFSQTSILHYKGESTSKDVKYLKHFYSAMKIFYQKHFQTNIFYNGFMKVGISLWHWIKRFHLALQKEKKELQEKNILYVGSENNILTKLQASYKNASIHVFAICETRVISRYDDLDKIEKMISEKDIDTIVFDQQNNPFSKIIFYMTHLSGKNLRFRIHPSDSDFIIGSDDKNSKGKVILLPD